MPKKLSALTLVETYQATDQIPININMATTKDARGIATEDLFTEIITGVNVKTVNGIDISPGSDVDCDLLTVGVTDSPKLWWDESEDSFVFTKPLLNAGIGQPTFGADAKKVIAVGNGTAPTSSPADCFQLYSADIAIGKAVPHFRTESGDIIKIYKLTTSVGEATFVASSGTNVNDNSTFGGYTIQQIVKALQTLGILA